MPNRLDEILAHKRGEVAARKLERSLDALDRAAAGQEPPRGFARTLHTAAQEGYALIAEIKRASPSKGLIRATFDPPALAFAYAEGGAACLSVLTDERYFQGLDDFLGQAREASNLPCLRKDFTVDPWQVAEARALGADAILLIVAALEDEAMHEIEAAAAERGMDVLVEVHDADELERALHLRSRLIGINNRDLRDFSVDPERAWRLAEVAPPGAQLVAESGISTHADLAAAAEHGIRTFLVGESLMRQADVAVATRALLTGA